jgi:hypothetical protein
MPRSSDTEIWVSGECDRGPRDLMPLREPKVIVDRKALLPVRRERARTIK